MAHFIMDIEIEHFKCFNGFKASGFERINLIGGKNNIGKTAFMEACYINVRSTTLRNMVGAMISIKFMRENVNLLTSAFNYNYQQAFMEQCDGISIETNINQNRFQISDENGEVNYKFNIDNVEIVANKIGFSYDGTQSDNIKFIDNHGWSDHDIASCYSDVQRKDKEHYINQLLNEFDSEVTGFKVINKSPVCKTTDDKYRGVTEFGDGLKHLLSVATALFSAENGYLFIDEIDNGIHYTTLDQFWEFIFELAEEFHVQVFATTHSLECVSSFNRVQMEKGDTNSTYIEMAKNKATNEIFMTPLNSEQLEYELGNDGRFRGE